jgi:alanyl-tRNA synthetase
MTKHLYYDDSYLREFSAVVLERIRVEGKPAVILDQTAFYPASGGQPCDTGSLAEAQVLEVQEDDSGRIRHVLDRWPDAAEVHGRIDWQRRFDHMQQHTGQHILSQAFLAVAGANTVSFHLGQDASTIDLDVPPPEPGVLSAVEETAAGIVFEDRPVLIRYVSKEDLGALGVRKESQREGEIRIIEVAGFDRSPCGGTHVRRCGEIGMICILGSERYKGGTRIEFVCGTRVLKQFRADHDTLKELGRIFSAHPHELPALVDKCNAERSALLRECRNLEERLLETEVLEMLQSADMFYGIAVVRRQFDDRKIEILKILAQKLTDRPGVLAILGASREPAQIVVARSREVAGDCGAAVREACGKHGGKGGGRPELAQAGGIAGSSVEAWSHSLKAYFASCWSGTVNSSEGPGKAS